MIDIENFNFEEIYEECKKEVKRPNILICGASGVGKSSLINSFFGKNLAEVGNDVVAKTKGIHLYSIPDAQVNLYDSEGYEIGGDKNERFKSDVLGFIDKKREDSPNNMDMLIHEVWYCISAGNKKVHDVDIELIKEIKDRKIPVMIILTKIDMVDKDELDSIKIAIDDKLHSIEVYTYSIEMDEDSEVVQRVEIEDWAIRNLDESLREGLIPSLKTSLKNIKKQIIKHDLPMYGALAGGIVLGGAVVNLPFGDSAGLIILQTKMAMDIISKYGINGDMAGIVKGMAGSTFVSLIGKTVASELVGIIPGIGNATKIVVNLPVAVTITITFGAATTLLCEKYLKECIDNDGDVKIPFSEFFTKEKLDGILSYLSNEENAKKEGFNIKSIVESVMNNLKKK